MKRWIQNAIRHPGRLRRYVQRTYGKAGFTERGTIRVEVLREIAERNDGLGKAARLALRLRQYRRQYRRT